MAIIPILFFALVAVFGFGFGGTTHSSEAYSSELSITPSAAATLTPGITSPPSKVVHSMFKYRLQLPSCGTIRSDSRGQDGWACLQDAADSVRDGRGPGTSPGAELVRVGMTDEGDPVRTYYRISVGQLEIFTDNSQDSFRGDAAWIYDSCPIPDDVRSLCTGS